MAYWIDTGTGVSTDPGTTAVISAIRQYATEGGQGVSPTIPGAEWFNMMTGEVLAVLQEAGISPDKANQAQLVEAIKKVISDRAATQSEVNNSDPSTQTDKFVTVKTLWGWVKQASESVLGLTRFATQPQVDAGTADDVVITPKKARNGFTMITTTGALAVRLPTFLGSWLVQCGTGVPTAGFATITLPISYPAADSYVALFGHRQAISPTGLQSTIMDDTTRAPGSFTIRQLYFDQNGIVNGNNGFFWFTFGKVV
ncbi:MAG: hypothetical protein ACRC4V_08555 [Aeromonas veronii]